MPEYVHDRRRSAAPRSVHGPKALVFVWRLAIAALAVVVCAGVVGLGRWSTSPQAWAIELSPPDPGVAEPYASTQEEHHQLQEGATDAVPKAIEPAVDSGEEDDDPLWDLPEDLPLALHCLTAPHDRNRVFRASLTMDPSRFAGGRALPRGPPA